MMVLEHVVLVIDLNMAISEENNKPTTLYLAVCEDRMTRGQVAKLRDTAEELYIAASKLSEERHWSETSITGGRGEMFSAQEIHTELKSQTWRQRGPGWQV